MEELFASAAGLLIGCLLMAVALLLRRCALVLREEAEVTRMVRGLIAVAWPLGVTAGTAGLLFTLVVMGMLGHMLVLLPSFGPAVVGLTASLGVVSFSFIALLRAGRHEPAESTPRNELHRESAPGRNSSLGKSPLGLVTVACVLLAVFGAVLAIVDYSLGGPVWEGPPPSFLMIGGAVAMILVVTGMGLLRCSQLFRQTRPQNHSERDHLADTLRKLSYLYLVLGFLLALLPGVLLGAVMGMMALGALAASFRASRIEAMWTLVHTLQSGRAVADELAVQSSTARGPSRRWLRRAADDLAAGRPLSHILYSRGVVPRGCWLQVAGGLASGKLPEALRAAAARETLRFARSSEAGNSRHFGTYVLALLAVIGMTVGFILYFIVPKFKKIFEDFNTQLPNATQAFLTVSDSLVRYWYVLLPLSLGALVLLAWTEVQSLVQGRFEVIERYLGPYWLRLRAPDLLRGLRWAVEAGRPLDQVLLHMSHVPLPMAYRARLHQASLRLQRGEDPWQVLYSQGWISPPEAELLRIAQENGNLPWALDTLSNSSELSREYKAAAFAEFAVPLMLLGVGVVVALIVYCFFLPLVFLIVNLA